MKKTIAVASLILLGVGALARAGDDRADDDTPKKLARVARLEWARDLSVRELLADESVDVRRAAARAVGRIAAPGDEIGATRSAAIAQGLVERLAQEKEASVRRELLRALGQAGSPVAVRELLRIRDAAPDASPDDERTAAAAALRLAAQVEDRPALVLGLASALPDVRRDSALALGVIERKRRAAGSKEIDPATRQALLRALAGALERAPEVAHACIYALAALGDPHPDVREALVATVAGCKDADTRAEAARGLARITVGDLANEKAPEALLRDEADARVAPELVKALAKHVQDPRARKRVVEHLAHASFHARREAAAALAQVVPAEQEGEVAALEKALDDPYATVRAAALKALARRSPESCLERTAVFLAQGTAARIAVARALAVLADNWVTAARAKTLLEKLARDDGELRVRQAALAAYGESKAIEGPLALALDVLASSLDCGLVEEAASVAVEKGKDDERAEPALLAAYERTRDRRDLAEARETIVQLLAERGEDLGPIGRRLLRRASSDPVPSVASAGAKALAAVLGQKLAATPRERGPLAIAPRTFKGSAEGKHPVLLVETTRGSFEVELATDEAPLHCSNVLSLVEKKFYDGLTWHRVVSSFVVQGGCPKGDGSGDPGYTIPDEVSDRPYVRGTLGMPKSAMKDTGGCQLFFTHGRTPHLDGRYTVFGQVTKGVEVLDQLEEGDGIVKIVATARSE